MIQNRKRWCSIAITTSALFTAVPAAADTDLGIAPLVVTTTKMQTPYSVSSDPRQPRIGLPAQDGGAFLKSVPGFSVSRKGGTSGDPELRGLGGSRLNILMNGTQVSGGCSGRMDPPTAYTFPQSYDRIEITKGPQSVRYGTAPAGSVRFERDAPGFTEPDTEGFASFTAGSWRRSDLAAGVTSGNEDGYSRLIGTLSTQDDYRDGDGERVHSAHERWSSHAALGWTPGEDTRVEFAYERSDAEAAYDDRRMDGTDFDRTGYRLSATRQNLADWLPEIELVAFHNDIDHVMDNFRLRDPGMMTMTRRVDRETTGGRLSADFVLAPTTALHAGVDYSESEHGDSGPIMAMGDPIAGANFRDQRTEKTSEFLDVGVFAELEHDLDERRWITFGLRGDYHEAEVFSDDYSNVSAGATDHSSQWSGFGRYEIALQELPLNLYAGLGRSERAPDFWERERDFRLKTETLSQADIGTNISTARLEATLALFHGRYSDYILITDEGASARNIDAITNGVEADLSYALSSALTFNASAAFTRSRNDTDGTPLAQTPPLEGTLALDYEISRHRLGVEWRGVARQHRIDPGNGTIYSVDTTETPGFATLSAYVATRIFEGTRLSVGVDNIGDRRYAEHIQRGSADLGASEERINEPGRAFWANITTEF